VEEVKTVNKQKCLMHMKTFSHQFIKEITFKARREGRFIQIYLATIFKKYSVYLWTNQILLMEIYQFP
jgi:hypothetical protein